MSEHGTFIVDRGLFEHPVFAAEPFTEREAWLWLISEAAFKQHRKRVGKCVVDLARGQVAHSTRFMAKAWKWSERSVRRYLDRLCTEQMIVITASAAVMTQITICNYNDYQRKREKRAADAPQMRRRLEETKVEERASASADPRARAIEISNQIWAIFGWAEFLPPAWFGLPYMIETGLRADNWEPDLIVNAARKVMANGRLNRLRNYRGFGLVIADEHELARAPIPIIEPYKQDEANGQPRLPLVRIVQSDWRGSASAQDLDFGGISAVLRARNREG